MAKAARAARAAWSGCGCGDSPHRHQSVADVIDQNAALGQYAFRCGAERVGDPGDVLFGTKPATDAAVIADVTEEDADLGDATGQQIGTDHQLTSQIRREVLLELHPQARRRLFLLGTREAGRRAARQKFDKDSLQLRQRRRRTGPKCGRRRGRPGRRRAD